MRKQQLRNIVKKGAGVPAHKTLSYSTMGNKQSTPYTSSINETNEQKLMRQLEEMKREKRERDERKSS